MAEAPLTREQRRSRRKRAVRKVTVNVRRLSLADRAAHYEAYPRHVERPKTRLDCIDGPRPCPFVSCRHHLYLDVTRTGNIAINFPDLQPHEIPDSCALDRADEGGATLESVAETMNLTRERIRQLEVRALAKVAAAGIDPEVRDVIEPGFIGKRKLPVISTRELDKELRAENDGEATTALAWDEDDEEGEENDDGQ